MVSNKKIYRSIQGPGVFEITLGALLGVMLGVLIASLKLIITPVNIVSKLPDNADSKQVYFIEGSSNSNNARQWNRKYQLLSGGTAADVLLNEDELNAWISSATSKMQSGASSVANVITPEKVNFRIQNGQLQVGMISKLAAFGLNQKLVVQTRGKFVQGANGFEFVADEFFMGSLPLHKLPGVTSQVISYALSSQEIPEDIKETWKKIQLLAVEDKSLHIVLP